MVRRELPFGAALVFFVALAAGCQSPYYADRGALFGGVTGAGLGALVGQASGNAGAGAVVGAGVGAMTGAAVGDALDGVAAENRAAIARQLGRPVPTGAATIGDVVAMSRAGVDDRLIVTHVRNSGIAAPLTAADVIYLHEQSVSTPVIEAMQRPVAEAVPVPVPVALAPPPPMLIEPYPYRPPPFHAHYGFYFQ